MPAPSLQLGDTCTCCNGFGRGAVLGTSVSIVVYVHFPSFCTSARIKFIYVFEGRIPNHWSQSILSLNCPTGSS